MQEPDLLVLPHIQTDFFSHAKTITERFLVVFFAPISKALKRCGMTSSKYMKLFLTGIYAVGLRLERWLTVVWRQSRQIISSNKPGVLQLDKKMEVYQSFIKENSVNTSVNNL